MLKKLINTLLLSVLIISAKAQKNDQVIARAYYTYQNTKDTISSGKTRSEDMLLFIGKNSSLFGSFTKIKYEISEEQKFIAKMENTITNKPTAFKIDETNSKWMTTNTYINSLQDRKFYTTSRIAYQAYLIEEPTPDIKWKIQKDTLTIGGLKCKKATGTIDNKEWEVYFTEEVPFSGGPYILQGLPGLIVEAKTKDGIQAFSFTGLENAADNVYKRFRDVTKRVDAHPGDYNAIDQAIGRDMGNAFFENYIRISPGAIKVKKEELEKLQKIYSSRKN